MDPSYHRWVLAVKLGFHKIESWYVNSKHINMYFFVSSFHIYVYLFVYLFIYLIYSFYLFYLFVDL
jgi:hypothetical protein